MTIIFTAQEIWKSEYRQFHIEHSMREKAHLRAEMRLYIYEAALERKLAAAQRKIYEMQDQIWRLEAHAPNYDDGIRLSQRDPRVPIEIRDPRWSDDGS